MMAKASKPVALCGDSKLTKAEIRAREEAEQKLKGTDDLVYQCPKGLSKKEQELYEFIVNQLKSSGILNNLDIEILKSTVFCIVQLNEAQEQMNRYGAVLFDDNGKAYKNPYATIYKDYHTMFITNSIRLGLTPSDRAKLAIMDIQSKEKEESKLLQILGDN